MKLKVYKPALLALMGLAMCSQSMAQNISVSVKGKPTVNIKGSFNEKEFNASMDNLSKSIDDGLKDLGKNISAVVNNVTSNLKFEVNTSDADGDVSPKFDLDLGDLLNNLNISVSADDADNDDSESNLSSIKSKNYSKSYPLDANDRIKLSNQYGKIAVNTWERHEVKVDVVVRAEANSDNDAQKLLDGVEIRDSKSNDQVSFRTDIAQNDNSGFWSLFKLGNSDKKHKLTINYTVYMPAKTDLNVESSYGSIELPDLDGKVRVSSSYGSTSIHNLSNASNNIEGSYGSLKVGSMNGGRLGFSYGSVDVDECNNLKADLSYGSFKIGKLNGSGDFDLSYEGGFRIGELAGSVKRLNINSSYSGATVGITPASNFDFDITTSYGGFNYNDNNVFITSKNPPDGSRHIGTTRNYKGHVGKGNSDAKVTINTSYGGVHFE
ncbi:MAG TPA: hypothetical protein VIM55_10760 [Mucilaginibacter sp.]